MFAGKLKPYQEEPVQLFLERGNLLVAYEMGLGKTVIGIAAAEELLQQLKINCCLVVCPASLKFQWRDRIHQFTDDSITCVIDGSPSARQEQYLFIEHNRPEYVICSYDIVVIDEKKISALHPGMVILDEITAIKSFKAQRSKKIKKILSAPFRLGLTGTPVENRPDELYSIMQWVDPKVLGRFDLYDKAYVERNKNGWVTAYKNLPVLRKKMQPVMSRRSRHDPEVAPYLPDVDEDNWEFYGDKAYDKLYRRMAEDCLEELKNNNGYFDFESYYSGDSGGDKLGRAMGILTCMEMLIDHPDLLIMSGQRLLEGLEGSAYAYQIWQEGCLDSIFHSPKLIFMRDKLAPIMMYPESKVLIYTKYRHMLPVIQDSLDYRSVLFHGQMNATARNDAITSFMDTPDVRVFISSHAGAYGIDMSKANHLINYDYAWSAGRADQINGRHVRASSEFSKVFIHNMVMRYSLDEYKQFMVGQKRLLSSSILDGHGHDDVGVVDMAGISLHRYLTKVAKRGILER